MNPDANKKSDEDDRDEKRIASMLSSAGKDVPPPDPAFLARLREQSTEAFLAAQVPQASRRRLMFPGSMRWAASLAAAIALLVGGYFLFLGDPGPELGTVLQSVARADSLHVKVTRDGKSSELWTARGGKLRWDEADGTYQVSRDGRLWRIDEKAKRKTPRQAPYLADGGKGGLDALALLDLGDDERALLARQKPIGTVMHDGHKCFHYHVRLPGDQIAVDALVDVATQHLVSLEAQAVRGEKVDPLAVLTVLSWNQPIDEDKFVVKDGLSEDGRLGKLVDVQGVVAVKPVMHDRWTPVRPQLPLKAGDWIQTDFRGANAAAIRLEKQGQLILGPGSLVELVTAKQIRVHSGIVEVDPAAKTAIEVVGPFKKTVTVNDRVVVRVDQEKLVRVPKEPLWLQGFKGTTTKDAVGSLIAKVDGRNVPLTVGYHKVSVDIRDQIARTTIEESFVNHTDLRLEGVFNFPLPQDASISGFGMWIGNELVEADVVEKQRAREIYETIRSENRDPGLLEWNGGNIFTARVWPIFAHSEKRIKITYTQVLPLRGDKFTYSYALQSEMLKQHPLRELAIDVKINSAVPIKSVECPSHSTRNEKTKNSAHVEFSAKEYTPDKDFEVVTEIDGAKLPIVLVPHRRGDDGYFLLEVMPPAAGTIPDRSILANGKPLNLILLADTSASMDPRQRAEQSAFLAALLTSLTPKDTFNLGACDVDCAWIFPAGRPATSENVRAAREFLAGRSSLGWTDLDRAFASAFKQTTPSTHVIYIGDGVSTARDADPVAFSKRLRRMYESDGKGGVHAVAVGSTHEMSVLRTMGSLGGGSVRRVAGEQTPAVVAHELLDEICQPALRDLKVEFTGVRTARVYPEQLPNVPAGAQQIILGRYLPNGADKAGEVVVTGTLDGKPVRYTAPIVLKDAESGNSFIPRLWARQHLDVLLEQGTSDGVKEEIIALSEEYNIITPYTSLLVLESDADRERFKVKRRFQMRDGEKFFAEGRDNANYELKQKQMKAASNYRVGLRKAVLRKLATLGRDPSMFNRYEYRSRSTFPTGRSGATKYKSLGGQGGGMGWRDAPLYDADPQAKEEYAVDALREEAGLPLALNEPLAAAAPEAPAFGEDREENAEKKEAEFLHKAKDDGEFDFEDLKRVDKDSKFGYFHGKVAQQEAQNGVLASTLRYLTGIQHPSVSWFDNLVPRVPAPPLARKEGKSTWSAEAQKVAQSLLRDKALAALKGGIVLNRRTEKFDSRRNMLRSRHDRLEMVGGKSWLTLDETDQGPATVEWLHGKERGIYYRPLGLGRVRNAEEADQASPLDLGDFSLETLDRAFADYQATLDPQDGVTTLVLKHRLNPKNEVRVRIDNEKHVVLSLEHLLNGKTDWRTTYSDFVEAAGSWWARKIETRDAKGNKTEVITVTVQELDVAGWERAWKAQHDRGAKVQLFRQPLPMVTDAKRALAAGKVGVDERMTLTLHFARSQQWARAEEHLAQAEKLAGKPGMRWLTMGLTSASRRNEELRQRYYAEAKALAELPEEEQAGSDALYLANHLLSHAPSVLESREMLTLLDRLAPMASRQPAHRGVNRRFAELRVNNLPGDQALALLKKLATEYPTDAGLQYQYAQRLGQAGEYPAAYSWITGVLTAEGAKWTETEDDNLRSLYTGLLESQGRYAEIVDYTATWMKRNPHLYSAYGQHLSALVKTDQEKKADALIERWLAEGRADGTLEAPVFSRLYAAVNQALGQGHNLYTNRMEAKWVKPLLETAQACARRPQTHGITGNILSHHAINSRDEGRELIKKFADDLVANLANMPIEQVRAYAGWIMIDAHSSRIPWTKVAEGLHQRWAAEAKLDEKQELSRALVTLLSSRGQTKELIDFRRQELKDGPADQRQTFARQLFDLLLTQSWTAEIEEETFGLLDRVAEANDLAARVALLHQWNDRMVEGRVQAEKAALKNPEKLTRTELSDKMAEFRRAAQIAIADRLRKEAGNHGKGMTPWFTIEADYFDTRVEREPKRVIADCWSVLGDKPKASATAEEGNESAEDALFLDAVLRNRGVLTLGNLAARKDAGPELAAKLFRYFAAGQEVESDNRLWKAYTYEMLLALDRAKELETTLAQWVKAEPNESQWRLALGFLVAEQGRIPEAIALFEKIEASDDLASTAYRSLADWYMVVDRRADHVKAKVAMYKTMPEHQLSRMIQIKLGAHQRTDTAPPAFDPEVLLMFEALFAKATFPQNYLWQVQQFYQATHDFRLLAGLADAVVGQTAMRVYPFLAGMRGVLNEVRDEATADEIFAQITKARKRANTDIDRRALDLLEMLVRWRAARMKNQPGPHADAALAAFRRAVKPAWTEGEPALMADLLASMGAVDLPALAREQLRVLEELHKAAKPGTAERLHLAHRLGQTLNAHNRGTQAADVLEAALREYQQAHANVLPASANDVITTYISVLEQIQALARAEKFLQEHRKNPFPQQQYLWLTLRLYELYTHALTVNGEVSLGKGQDLYKGLEKALIADLGTTDHNHRLALLNQLIQVYRIGHKEKLDGADGDLRAFAFNKVPELLKAQSAGYDQVVSTVAHAVRDVLGARDAVHFLIETIEREPRWLRLNNNDGWARHAYSLGQWRSDAGETLGADLEARLLRITLAELRLDLETMQQRSRTIYYHHHGHYWPAKEAEFVKVAEDVLSKRLQSRAALPYLADYFYWGVAKHGRAIEILQASHAQKLLDVSGRSQLVNFLHAQNRYGESVAVLAGLIEEHPGKLGYRTQLMTAYFKTGKQADLKATLKSADDYFHKDGRWSEHAMAGLGQACHDCRLWEACVGYYKELIPLHQRTHPNRGSGDGSLARYYINFANAYAGLKKTPEAVDAACAAIVSWGRHINQRAEALNTLRHVLQAAPNLDAFITEIDQKGGETGMDSAIVRKAIGEVLMDKGELEKATRQLRRASELQPGDADTNKKLLDCFDRRKDQAGAVAQILASVQLSRRDLALYEDLGNRYTALNRGDEAERAFTSIVEMMPTDASSHMRLAGVREKQDRWDEALRHWEEAVRLRVLEPDPLIGLARAQIHLAQWQKASDTLAKLKAKEWPPRFTEAHKQIKEIEKRIGDKK